jgi:predicted phosphate transport protein (TIGR00153 family)
MFNLLPKDTVFFDLFEGIVGHVVSSTEHLRKMVKAFPDKAATAELQQIRDAEHEADNLAHEALKRLDSTFITPFDREDIHELIGGMDDIVDTVDAIAKRITLYHLKGVEPWFVKQTDVLFQASTVVGEAIYKLRKARKLSELADRLIEIHRLESIGDDNNHAAVSELYNGKTDCLEVIKWKEFYDMIEMAIDACEDVGNTLERIVLKNG